MLRLDEWYYSYDAESDPDELLDSHRKQALEALMLERININILNVEYQANNTVPIHQSTKPKWMAWSAAGIAAMLLMAVGIYFVRSVKPNNITTKSNTATLPDQKNKLMLTLSDGKKIDLASNIKNLKESDGTKIEVNNNTITYHNTGNGNPNAQNILSVPTGQTYKLNLSDGTAVWLNNVSELTYPVSFDNAADRIVTLKGEAYFEVFHDASRPFKVNVVETEITVLGTKFNVNTFNKGAIATTLLEGSVRVASNGKEGLLKPGQQAISAHNDINITNADVQKTIAWKNGYFNFREDGIENILNQIARWYDLDIKYQTPVTPGLHYSGKIRRAQPLDDVLMMLTDITDLKFKHVGNTLWVGSK